MLLLTGFNIKHLVRSSNRSRVIEINALYIPLQGVSVVFRIELVDVFDFMRLQLGTRLSDGLPISAQLKVGPSVLVSSRALSFYQLPQ